MRKKSVVAWAGAVGAGLVLALASPASAAGTGVIHVPGDFVPALSDTRATGQYHVVGTALNISTQGNTSTDKVAEYVATNIPLADVGEPNLDYTTIAGSIPPGFQLVIDFNHDGTADGILVGEPTFYGNEWWLSNGSAPFVKAAAPSHTGGFGSDNHGTLDQWRAVFPNANVVAFGFSLGSGVYGNYNLNAINFAGTRYTFANTVVLHSKDECKNGGWAASTSPVYKNQGDCVSAFASAK